MESGPVTVAPVPAPADQEVTEEYLRSLEKVDLLVFLNNNGVDVPTDVSMAETSEIVDWVLNNFAD